MASVKDVASYILLKKSPMPAMKLQKLVYYCQAWSLVWDDEPLFSEKIEAWANGPVVKELFNLHKGKYLVDSSLVPYRERALSPKQIETIDIIIKDYGDKPSQWLSDLTHLEAPWRETREESGLSDGERGNVEITHARMYDYYSNL